MSSRSVQTGFTIAEILIGAAIVALILVIAVPMYQGYVTSAETIDSLSTLKGIQLEVRAPAKIQQGLHACDNSLIDHGNLENQYLSLKIESVANDALDPLGGAGFAAMLAVTATVDKQGSEGVRVAKAFLEELTKDSQHSVTSAIVTDSVVNFGVILSIPGQPYCKAGKQAVASAGTLSPAARGYNRPPVAGQSVDLGSVSEDSTNDINLSKLVSSSFDPDGDALTVAGISSSIGKITSNSTGGFQFTSANNFKGEDIGLTFTVTDGLATASGSAVIDVKSEVDPARGSLSIQVQRVAFGLQGGSDEGWIKPVGDRLDTSGDLNAFTAEFVYAHDPSITIGIYQDFAAYGEGDTRFSLWTGGKSLNLTPGGDTTIDLNDGKDHRVTVTWSGTDNVAHVYDNGIDVKQFNNFFPGKTQVVGDSYFNAGSKFLPGSYGGQDQFVGKLLSLGMSSDALSAAEVRSGPIYSVRDASSGLLFDLRSTPGSGAIQDQTGRNTFELKNDQLIPNQLSSVSATAPGPGDKLVISASISPSDPDDVITSISMSGFSTGTVVSVPGQANLTIGGNAAIDLGVGSSVGLTAVLPAGRSVNTNLILSITTTDPDGNSTDFSLREAIIMDPTSARP